MTNKLKEIRELKHKIRTHIEMIEINTAKFFKRQGKQEAKEEMIEIIDEIKKEFNEKNKNKYQKEEDWITERDGFEWACQKIKNRLEV